MWKLGIINYLSTKQFFKINTFSWSLINLFTKYRTLLLLFFLYILKDL